ncbi:cysteine desulfurase-like protein [Angustibacter speluncae]
MTIADAAPSYDVERVRADFPALASGTAHFDGPGGSQVPRQVAHAVASTLGSSISNRGTVTAAARRAEDVVVGCRAALGDLLATDPGGVVFGRSATALTFEVARAMAQHWGPGDEVVVTRLDHDGNIRPWVVAAERAGATVRWAGFDRETGVLDVADVEEVLSDRTRLVAVTGASNLLGTRPDVPAVSAAAHAVGALVCVDAVHLTPHAVVDRGALGADLLTCSPYKYLGPHCGVLAADAALLERFSPDRLLPSTDAVPERYELGTLPYELMAGAAAAVEYLAALVPGEGSRRERLVRSMTALDAYEEGLVRRLEDGLAATDGVRLVGSAPHRTPTRLFEVEGVGSAEVADRLAAADVNAPAGHFYALEASRWLGLGDTGAVRAGIAPYTTADEVDRLLEVVAEVAGAR